MRKDGRLFRKGQRVDGNLPHCFYQGHLMIKNANANALAKLASMRDVELLDPVSVEFLVEPNIRRQPKIMKLTQEPSWMDTIIAYLRNDEAAQRKDQCSHPKTKNSLLRTL